MTGSPDCCARAAKDHMVAAPRTVMNSRRLINPPEEQLIDVFPSLDRRSGPLKWFRLDLISSMRLVKEASEKLL
jgi:hypothetical protein